MAKLFGNNAAVDFAAANLMSFGKSFSRLNGQPLDKSEVWYDKAALDAYALTDAAYVGQKVFYVDVENNTVTHYSIEIDGSLKELGNSIIGDNKSIVVAEDGTISLKGVPALDFVKRNEDGSAVKDDEGNEVKVNYQPLMTEAGLTWVIPSATTVEGLATEIEGLKARATALENVVGKAASEGVDATGLVKDVADNAAAIDALNGKAHEHSNKDAIDGITAEKVAAWDEAEENAKSYTDELANGAVKDNTDAIAAIKDGKELDSFADVETAIGNIDNKIGDVVDGKTLAEMIADAKSDATYDDTELSGRVSANETALAKLNANAETEGSVDYKIVQAVAAIMENPDDTMNSINELVTWINGHADSALALSNQVETNKSDIEALEGLVGTTGVAKQIADAIEAALKVEGADKYALASDLTAAIARIVTLEGKSHEHENKSVLDLITAEKVEAWDSAEQNAKDYADDLDEAMGLRVDGIIEALKGKVDVEEGKSLIEDTLISKLEGIAAGAQVNVIDSVDETQFAIDEDKKLTLLDIAMSKVTGLEDALEGKVDKVEGSRLLTADEATKLEKLVLGENGEVSVSGKVAAGNVDGLEDWITTRAATLKGLSENNLSDTLLTKLNGIENGAQANVIESIKLGETALEITNKEVVIPVGAGLKASDEIAIAADGTLGVGEINVNKLVQNDNEYLVLNGGAAAI